MHDCHVESEHQIGYLKTSMLLGIDPEARNSPSH